MKQHLKLLVEWDAFENEHPESGIEDFCRYYLIKNSTENKKLMDGNIPPSLNGVLGKLLTRIGAINAAYFKIAFREEEMEKEWFDYLNTLHHFKESKKTFVINYNFSELSTGIDILNRLKKRGYISERSDPEDKRARLVKITVKGEKTLKNCWDKLRMLSAMVYSNLSDDEKKLVVQLLGETEIRNSRILSESRNKSFKEMMAMNDSKKKE